MLRHGLDGKLLTSFGEKVSSAVDHLGLPFVGCHINLSWPSDSTIRSPDHRFIVVTPVAILEARTTVLPVTSKYGYSNWIKRFCSRRIWGIIILYDRSPGHSWSLIRIKCFSQNDSRGLIGGGVGLSRAADACAGADATIMVLVAGWYGDSTLSYEWAGWWW